MAELCSFADDISGVLRPGVFLLGNHDRVIYVGKARCILAALANHIVRNRVKRSVEWFPIRSMIFDRIEIIPCDVARATTLAAALITLYNPLHNQPAPAPKLRTFTLPPPHLDPQTPRRL